MQWTAGQQHPSPSLSFRDPVISPTQDLRSNLNHPDPNIRWQQTPGFPHTYPPSSSILPLTTQTGPPFRAAQSQVLSRPGYHTDSQVQIRNGQEIDRPFNGFGAALDEGHSSQFMVCNTRSHINPGLLH
jgi:hypothetical protein